MYKTFMQYCYGDVSGWDYKLKTLVGSIVNFLHQVYIPGFTPVWERDYLQIHNNFDWNALDVQIFFFFIIII